jgi:hypothetical protein
MTKKQRKIAVERQAGLPQPLLDQVGARAGGVEPEADAPRARLVVAPVAGDEGFMVVGHAEVPGVEQQAAAGELARALEWRRARRDLDRRRIALEHDALARNALLEQPLPLVLAEDFEAVDPLPQGQS